MKNLKKIPIPATLPMDSLPNQRARWRLRGKKLHGVLWAPLLLFLAACAGLAPDNARPVGDAGNSYTSHPPLSLPPEAQSYLADLSRAFRAGDGDFLLSQGEALFEAQIRPAYDAETYLALLYRAGPLAGNAPAEITARAGDSLPRLNYRQIRGIEYSGWAEEGPLLRIQGRFLTRNGEAIPCEILLVWKLVEPKVLGVFP
jgi:hypothetical protein